MFTEGRHVSIGKCGLLSVFQANAGKSLVKWFHWLHSNMWKDCRPFSASGQYHRLGSESSSLFKIPASAERGYAQHLGNAPGLALSLVGL